MCELRSSQQPQVFETGERYQCQQNCSATSSVLQAVGQQEKGHEHSIHCNRWLETSCRIWAKCWSLQLMAIQYSEQVTGYCLKRFEMTLPVVFLHLVFSQVCWLSRRTSSSVLASTCLVFSKCFSFSSVENIHFGHDFGWTSVAGRPAIRFACRTGLRMMKSI